MDLYRILSVSKHATQAEIKAAYRRLALKYHPDLHPAGSARAEAETAFKTISSAYHVLSDASRRNEYDSSQGFSGGAAGAAGGAARHGYSYQRHANWSPRPRHEESRNKSSSSSSSSKSHSDYAQYARVHRQLNMEDVFNVPAWQAGHYGEPDRQGDRQGPVRRVNSWMNDAGPHQQYYARKREARDKKEKEEASKSSPKDANESAAENLRRRREERLRNGGKNEIDDSCVVS